MQEIWDSITGWVSNSLSDFLTVKIYIGCAIAGGTVILGQTGLNLFGLGGDADVDPDMDVDALDGGDSLNFLSIRALAGFLTFFGLIGWTGTNYGWSPAVTVLAALASGASVMVMIAMMMRFFQRMGASGNVRTEQAVGRTAQVYLRIPGEKAGRGKVTLKLQGRSVEFEAVTSGPELPSGSECRLVRQISESTFEVESIDAGENS